MRERQSILQLLSRMQTPLGRKPEVVQGGSQQTTTTLIQTTAEKTIHPFHQEKRFHSHRSLIVLISRSPRYLPRREGHKFPRSTLLWLMEVGRQLLNAKRSLMNNLSSEVRALKMMKVCLHYKINVSTNKIVTLG